MKKEPCLQCLAIKKFKITRKSSKRIVKKMMQKYGSNFAYEEEIDDISGKDLKEIQRIFKTVLEIVLDEVE